MTRANHRSCRTAVLLLLTALWLSAPQALAAAKAPQPAAPPAAPAGAGGGSVVLDEGGWMRLFPCYRTPLVRGKDKELSETKAADFIITGTPPPAGWVGADFDDSSWARFRLDRNRPKECDYGFAGPSGFPPELCRQCLRGKFTVGDPAGVRDMTLAVVYRGGIIVYLNGKELARGGLAKDAAAANELLAEDYPPDAFLKADGKPIRAAFHDPETCKDRVELRLRRLEKIVIPSSALRKGVNVLAFECFRAPYHGNGLDLEGINSRTAWATCGLASFRLAAAGGATPNLDRPRGPQVWNLDRNDRLAADLYGDPAEALGPIVLAGAKNGFFTGQVAVTSTEPIRGLKVEAGELKGPGTIPASALAVRYGVADGPGRIPCADSLSTKPEAEVPLDKLAGAAAEQVVLTVRVPKDAAPGQYQGALAVSAQGLAPVTIPVKLGVADWTIPDPAGFRTFVCAYQSPTSLALHYNVPEWSGEHWKYLERSFELLGALGNKAIHVPVVDRTQFGNDEGMVYWVKKEDGSFDYDFSVFDSYLKLAKKHCGPLDYVVLHVWHAGGWSDRGVKQENTVTVVDKKSGKREHLQVPVFATEESRKFWTPVLLALKERLAKEGMDKAFCLGTLSDSTAPKEVFQMFNEIIPDVAWHRGCHTMNPKMTPYYLSGKAGKVIFHEHCYGMALANPAKPLPKLWELRGCPGTAYFRGDFDNQSVLRFRTWGESALWTNKQGVGRFGLDFWNVLNAQESKGAAMQKSRNPRGTIGIYNRWPESSCAQREPTVYRLTTPGAEGAVPNLRYEAVREGLQESEALIFAAEAANLHADKLGRELADRIQALLLERLNFCRSREGQYGRNLTCHTGWQVSNARLFALAAEARAKLGK